MEYFPEGGNFVAGLAIYTKHINDLENSFIFNRDDEASSEGQTFLRIIGTDY